MWVLFVAPEDIIMSDGIKAGVVFVSKFCTAGAEFDNYISYIDRDDAVRNDNMYKFNLYNDYMGNSEKTSGLFTDKNDILNKDEVKSLKNIFSKAEENKSVMWQHVISFDNRWLKEQGLISKEENVVNEQKLREVTRVAMKRLQKCENLENALWSAAIHHNTDNIHIHIAMVEPVPMRKMKDGEIRGKLKLSSMRQVKSSIVNNILSQQMENTLINNIIRENMIDGLKKYKLMNDFEFIQPCMELMQRLPNDYRHWQYGYNSIKHLHPQIDKITDMFLDKYFKDDVKELLSMLDKMEEKYRTAYGIGKKEENIYAANKMKDVHYRLGNVLLKQLKEFDKAEKNRIYQEAKDKRIRLTQDKLNYYHQNMTYRATQFALNATIELTRIFMKDELQKMKTEQVYEQMEREIELNREK